MTLTDPTLREQIRRFERLVSENPSGLAFARLAEAYRRADEPALALEVVEEGIGPHPDYPAAHLVRARALLDLGRSEEAGRALRRVVELDPGNLVALRTLSRLARERGDRNQEEEWIRRIRRARHSRPARDDPGPEGETGGVARDPGSGRTRTVREILDGGEEQDDERETPRPASHSPEEREQLIRELADVADPDWWSAEDFTSGGPGDATARPARDAGGTLGEGEVFTVTLARLYAEQGCWEQAEEVYEELVRRRPGDHRLREGLERVRRGEVPPRAEDGERETARRGRDTAAPRETAAGRDAEGESPGSDQWPGGGNIREHLRALLAGRARPGLDLPRRDTDRPVAGGPE